jgi:hypothetical protein
MRFQASQPTATLKEFTIRAAVSNVFIIDVNGELNTPKKPVPLLHPCSVTCVALFSFSRQLHVKTGGIRHKTVK